ncbi:MAG: Gfo/Idh/MocA family oxidoreductase [Chloroflexota bacterium]|jgi:predicted dehydrogenase
MSDPVPRGAVRWGVLGTARIARNYVFEAIREAELCELTAVASRDEARARAAAAEFGIPRVHASYEALLADPDIEAVYLPLPNDLHAPWIRAAADAGKHILCEKPLTLDAAEADAVAAYCRDRDVLLMEAFMYRFHPAWAEVRRLLAEDAIGRLTDLEIWFVFRSRQAASDYRMTMARGGGALLDVGCYAVNLSRMLLGDEPDSVLAAARLDPSGEVDLTFSAILDYGDARSVFTASMEQEPDHRVRLHGTKGWLSVADPFNCPADHVTTITLASGGDAHPHHSSLRTLEVAAADHYGLQATSFARAILDGRPSPVPAEDAAANMRLIERLFAAAGLDGPGSSTAGD